MRFHNGLVLFQALAQLRPKAAVNVRFLLGVNFWGSGASAGEVVAANIPAAIWINARCLSSRLRLIGRSLLEPASTILSVPSNSSRVVCPIKEACGVFC